jgi:hypothetical protein
MEQGSFFHNIGCAHTIATYQFVISCCSTHQQKQGKEPMNLYKDKLWNTSVVQLFLDLYKEMYFAIGMGNMKKTYLVIM